MSVPGGCQSADCCHHWTEHVSAPVSCVACVLSVAWPGAVCRAQAAASDASMCLPAARSRDQAQGHQQVIGHVEPRWASRCSHTQAAWQAERLPASWCCTQPAGLSAGCCAWTMQAPSAAASVKCCQMLLLHRAGMHQLSSPSSRRSADLTLELRACRCPPAPPWRRCCPTCCGWRCPTRSCTGASARRWA